MRLMDCEERPETIEVLDCHERQKLSERSADAADRYLYLSSVMRCVAQIIERPKGL